LDTLSNILQTLHLRATVFMHACFHGDWAVDSSGEKRATFHMLAHGGCWLHLSDQPEPIALASGDLVVFPHDAKHTLSNSEQCPADDFPRNQPPQVDASGHATNLICGYFEFERHSWNPLLQSLPQVIIIRNEQSSSVPLMETLGRFLCYEMESDHPGHDLLINRLSEILFIHVVRCYMAVHERHGFIAALADQQIGKALHLMHSKPQKPWSIESLASAVAMSRSAFAERFSRLVEISPLQYLTRWRMTVANELFRNTAQSVAEVALACGYQSEGAFSKVFKKHFGYGPGKARGSRESK